MNKWVESEVECVDLGDERLNTRFKKILSQFSDRPSSSINGSFRGWHESKATYRFFDNSNVGVDKILGSVDKILIV
ncbi:MAG: transposase [Rickettsia endosymbiont of Culicoides impunctatus]|nr:MAG: transposase [Rickettsia endosymbiont of Culicoides impunctatus]